MRTMLALILMTVSTLAWAGGPHGHRNHHYHRHHNHWHWVAPAIVSGAVVYHLTRPEPLPPPVPYVYYPVPQPSYCTAWTEWMNPDGTVTRSRTCSQ